MKKIKLVIAVFSLLYFVSCSAPQTENKVQAADPAASSSQTAEAAATTKAYTVVKEQSSLNWMGSNKLTPKKHVGSIQLSEGTFAVANGQIAGGTFTADMNSIYSSGDEYTDGEKKAGILVDHLKSPDFFDVEKYPTSSFVISSVKPLEGNAQYNYTVTGNFTIKGITKEITFPAKIEITDSEVRAFTVFTIDRSQWDVKYGSETFFPNLGEKVIRNEIELSLNLIAAPAAS